jgi:hypothetical protein
MEPSRAAGPKHACKIAPGKVFSLPRRFLQTLAVAPPAATVIFWEDPRAVRSP